MSSDHLDMVDTMKQLQDAFLMLAELQGPSSDHEAFVESSRTEIQAFGQKIEEHEADMSMVLQDMKSKFEGDIEREVIASMSTSSMKSKLTDLVRNEITAQVKEQVDEQIKEHLPQSLQEQVDETKKQVGDVKISLFNSEARLQNSFVQTNYVFDRLVPILTSKGEKSPYYPQNVQCLFNYDQSVKELNKHYELTESDDLRMNFKQFLKHIGTNVEVTVAEHEN